ncbi:sugar kinase [Hydrogenophaga soli]
MPMHTEVDVLTLGEAMVLFAAQDEGPLAEVQRFAKFAAGAELNVAIGLSRLGWRVAYLSRLGQDSLGQYLLGVMQREGIATHGVRVSDVHRTGFMLKSRETQGADPQVEYHRKGSAASTMGPDDLKRLVQSKARHLHITGISPALSPSCHELVLVAIRWAKAQGMTVSFDPNLRPRLWASPQAMIDTLNAVAALCDWVLPGLAEGQTLTGASHAEEVARFYLDAGAQHVVVKLGREGGYGAHWASAQGQQATVPGVPVPQVVDTVGAGDGFAVGVISGVLEGLGWPQAVARGNAIGARVVQFPGDSDGLPRRHELGPLTL